VVDGLILASLLILFLTYTLISAYCFFKTLEIDTANSGKLVPSAITLKPMIKSETPKLCATLTPPQTAIPGLIHPSKVADEVIVRDYPVMLLLTLLLFILSYKFHKKHSISRFEGIVLVSVFSVYRTNHIANHHLILLF
jgi:hypothetical protein